jgi:hypothetical protein
VHIATKIGLYYGVFLAAEWLSEWLGYSTLDHITLVMAAVFCAGVSEDTKGLAEERRKREKAIRDYDKKAGQEWEESQRRKKEWEESQRLQKEWEESQAGQEWEESERQKSQRLQKLLEELKLRPNECEESLAGQEWEQEFQRLLQKEWEESQRRQKRPRE